MFWMNVADIAMDVGCWFLKVFRNMGYAILVFFMEVFNLARRILYAILTIAYTISLFAFLVSFYYFYCCYKEFKNGIALSNMENLPYALILFFVPIGIAIVREVVRPTGC